MAQIESSVDRVVVAGRARRRAVRKQVSVTCQTVREHDFRLVGERMVDLSAEGMLVLASASAKSESVCNVGDSLIVSFQSPELGIWFDLDARVARILAGRRRGDPGPAIGVEFTQTTALVRHLLRSLFHRARRTVPSRPLLQERARTVGVASDVVRTPNSRALGVFAGGNWGVA